MSTCQQWIHTGPSLNTSKLCLNSIKTATAISTDNFVLYVSLEHIHTLTCFLSLVGKFL